MGSIDIPDKLAIEIKESLKFLFRVLDDEPDFEDVDLNEVRDLTHRIGNLIVDALVSSAVGERTESNEKGKTLKKGKRDDQVENALIKFTEEPLKKFIVGQDKALSEVAKSIRIGAKKLLSSDRKHILTTMVFAGPTGVGKTETAKVLGEVLKPLGYEFIRVDLNLYSTPESAWTLIGSPRGYVGSDMGGVLTNRVRKSPRAVILFDEMEKANPLLHTTFMTLLDEGYIEDQSSGKRYYLDSGIILFTTNLMADKFSKLATYDSPEAELKARSLLETYFGLPEIVGRIDRVITFKNLEERDLYDIASKVLEKYGKEAYAYVLTRKYLPIAQRYGVRAFVRRIEEEALEGLEINMKEVKYHD